MATLSVPCPTCKTEVRWEPVNKHRPFCSKRCQLIDLGDWAEGRHIIPSDDDDIHAKDSFKDD